MATNTSSRGQKATLSTTTADLNLFVSVQVITLTGSIDATDSFTLEYAGKTTAAFVAGTNMTAAAIQAALRTLTGDSTLTASGSTDAGPFTVTWIGLPGHRETLLVTNVSGFTSGVSVNTDPGHRSTLRVSNEDASTALYFNYNTSTVPTSGADDTFYVAPGTTATVVADGDVLTCRVVGNGNIYNVELI